MRTKIKTRTGSILLVLCMIINILGSNHIPVSAAGRIRINKRVVTLQVGEKQRLSLKNVPKNGKVTWRSTSKSRATVSQKGVVTAKKQGRTTIKAKLVYKSEGKKRTKNFSCKVMITKKKSTGKSLVVYFSAPVQERSGQVDGISSASRTTTGKTYKGNTEYIAELIRKETKADMFEIIPQKAYANTYNQMVKRAEQEQERNERPAIKNKVKNISQYDTIYVGYPIWWSDMPQIMYTFFDTYDLKGKNIIPFCTHAGSGLSGTVGRIKKLEPQATVYKGLAIYRTDVTGSDSKVKSWIKKKEK
ncbi:MAG: flavodoxin [Lachnospiraceae bacterium]|nr:flavodoxin [Lachnospiraceae bacterium]